MAWLFKLYDIATDTLIADVTDIATATISARLNRPLSVRLSMPADQTVLQETQSDGDPALWPGTRAIKAYQDGVLRAHTIVWTCGWNGGVDYDMRVEVESFDPLIRMASRYVWADGVDITGTVIRPKFGTYNAGTSQWEITASTLLPQVFFANVTEEDNNCTAGTPLPFPIDYVDGTFDQDVNIWMSIPDGPMTIGDLIQALTDSGDVDVVLDPADSSMTGTYPTIAVGEMAVINVHNGDGGSDLSATVNFDYDTGDKNVAAARRVIDMTSLANRNWYYIGPKIGDANYQGDITATTFPTQQAIQDASRVKYGTYQNIRTYDDDQLGEGPWPLHEANWKTEVKLRAKPRDLLYLTPVAGGDNFTQFRPFIDYNLRDLVAVNTSANLGPAISAAKQRIYGFDVTIDADGVERVGELVCSADAE